MTHPFYTIGHGTRPLGEFVSLLQSVEVTLLVHRAALPHQPAIQSGTAAGFSADARNRL
jgi:uncharacterized protein (DUF488 family)